MTARSSYYGKVIVALLLVAAGVGMTALGNDTTGTLLAMTGLTFGGWARGLHTPAPLDADDELRFTDMEGDTDAEVS